MVLLKVCTCVSCLLGNTDHVSEAGRMLKAIKGSLSVCVCVCVSLSLSLSFPLSILRVCGTERSVKGLVWICVEGGTI